VSIVYLSGTGLGLGNYIIATGKRGNGTLLDGRRLLETVGINATKKIFLETHVVKVISYFIPVAFKLLGSDISATAQPATSNQQQVFDW
jgi:hypothetical protein